MQLCRHSRGVCLLPQSRVESALHSVQFKRSSGRRGGEENRKVSGAQKGRGVEEEKIHTERVRERESESDRGIYLSIPSRWLQGGGVTRQVLIYIV